MVRGEMVRGERVMVCIPSVSCFFFFRFCSEMVPCRFEIGGFN